MAYVNVVSGSVGVISFKFFNVYAILLVLNIWIYIPEQTVQMNTVLLLSILTETRANSANQDQILQNDLDLHRLTIIQQFCSHIQLT